MKKLFTIVAAALLAIGMNAQTQTKVSVELTAGTFDTDHITWTAANGNISLTQLKGSSTTAVNSGYVAAPRVYKGHILKFAAATNYTIDSVFIVCNDKYIGNTIVAGTSMSGDTLVVKDTKITADYATANGGTHTLANTDSAATFYIQNTATASNVQLRPTAITIVYTKAATTEPTISVNDVLDFGSVVSGVPATKTLSVEGENLTEAVTASFAGSNFQVDGTLTAEGGELTITALATTVGAVSDVLTLTSGTTTKTVAVSANVVVTEGKGTKENPFTCADVINLNNGYAQKAWVKGIIAGCANNGGKINSTIAKTNILLVDAAADTIGVPVALPSGTIQTALNLSDNNLKGYTVSVYGDLAAYFSTTGVTNTSDYELGAAPEPVDFDTVNITVSSCQFYDEVSAEGWWQVMGYDETEAYFVSLSPSSTTQILGTYADADLDKDYTYVNVVAEDSTLVTDSATVVVTDGASEGDYNFDAMIYVGTTAYHITMNFVKPVATTKYTAAIDNAQIVDYISDYGFVYAYGESLLPESTDTIFAQLAIYMDEAASGSFTQEDLDANYSYFEIAGDDYEIYTATYTVTYNADGSIVLAGTFLLYGNIQVNLTMTQPGTTAINNTEADVKTVKFIRNNQVVIEKNNVRYTVLGQEIR